MKSKVVWQRVNVIWALLLLLFLLITLFHESSAITLKTQLNEPQEESAQQTRLSSTSAMPVQQQCYGERGKIEFHKQQWITFAQTLTKVELETLVVNMAEELCNSGDVFMCLCVYVFVCLCVYVFMCLCVCVFMCLCVYVFMCLCVCVCCVL